ncbi:HIRA-interacting protein 3 isoform X1 [Pieris rapae]|uniref:HIRA-interacting protein 3 isoform X1 n=1 Tax=Pieris rapae TaxID=64459 RepID=UPI001E28103A|nr:HIRA-interacting protein 3 isoform X1 [Pieris rapae]
MNYEAERAMNQKRLRMEGEPGHGVVQGNGLPLNYLDNGHQIPYQPYAGAYNTHYPPPDAFAAYGPPPPGGYAPQNLSYAPPAHQNYAHHQSFPQQQAQLHMAQSHMGMLFKPAVQGYAPDVGIHKSAWPPQPHLLPPLDAQKPLDIKQLKPEIKLEPSDSQKRPHPEAEMIQPGDLEQPKIKIKTDIFKPDDMRVDDKSREASMKPLEMSKPDQQAKDDGLPRVECEKPPEVGVISGEVRPLDPGTPIKKLEEERKPFSSPELSRGGATPGKITPGLEPKKRGRPKGSTNKPKPPGTPTKGSPGAATALPAVRPPGIPGARTPAPVGRPRAVPYQYNVRPFRKDFSGIQFRRRWSDDCLDSSHIPNEVYFGDVPVPLSVLYNYYDANAERERLASQAAHIAAQKAAAAKLAAAKLRGVVSGEVTTVDSSSDDESSGSSGSGSEESDEDQPLKRGPGRPKGSRNSTPKAPGTPAVPGTPGSGRRGRPPVPPELRQPGITDMKKFCKAAGIRFDYKKLVEGCTKNKERVAKMQELLEAAGLEGKPTLEKCRAIKQAKMDKKEQEKQAKKDAKAKKSEEDGTEAVARRMTRGATGVKPRQRIVISSDEEDGTPAARRTVSKLRSSVNDESDSQ